MKKNPLDLSWLKIFGGEYQRVQTVALFASVSIKKVVAEAQSQLDGLLQAREALPGLAWTEEQSANVIIDARKRAEVQAEKRRKEASKETKNTFDLIIKGAKVGATVAGEEILNDPAAIMDHPELAREAAAFVALRNETNAPL